MPIEFYLRLGFCAGQQVLREMPALIQNKGGQSYLPSYYVAVINHILVTIVITVIIVPVIVAVPIPIVSPLVAIRVVPASGLAVAAVPL